MSSATSVSLRGDWVTAGDSSFFVLDLRTLSEFDLDGTFEGYPTRVTPSPLSLMAIATSGEQLFFAKDVIDRSDGSRNVETWRLEESGEHTLLRSDPMPPLPRSDGQLVRGMYVDQAEPLWAYHQHCVFLSDGAGEWIVRIHLPEMRADTIFLPARSIPARTRRDEARLDRIRRAGARVGMSTGTSRTEPTARVKWQDMIVDPDGYVWLEPWRPHSMRRERFLAWVVNPATGAVDSVPLEAFPRAFLAEGGYVSVAYDTATAVNFLRGYGATAKATEGS